MAQHQRIKKIVITGGAGFIGNTLIKALPRDINIVIIDNFHIDTHHKREINKQLKQHRNISLIEANVAEINKYQEHLDDVDAVVYMASLNSHRESNERPLFYLTENVLNMQYFLDALKQKSPKIQKLVLTSSRGVYGEGAYSCVTCGQRLSPIASDELRCPSCNGSFLTPQPLKEADPANPSSYYGLTKKLQEDVLSQFALQQNIPLDIIRIFNVFGEDQGNYYSHIGIIPMMEEIIKNTGELPMSGDGNLTRDFVHVNDVVAVLIKAVFGKNIREQLVEIFNLGSGHAVSIADLADYFAELGYTFTRKPNSEYRDVRYSVADHKKIKQAFGITSFQDIEEFLKNLYTREAQIARI